MEWLAPVTLVGHRLRLEPVSDRHYDGLVASADGQTFEFYTSAPESWDANGFRSWIETRTGGSYLCMAMVEAATGSVIGCSTFFDASERHRHLEIGYTWVRADLRGTWVNPEAKLLMLQHAFDSLGCVRVQLKCDATNKPSRAAILKLGAQFEGVLRHNMVLDSGRLRDTAYHSVLAEEWPAVRERLVERVSSF